MSIDKLDVIKKSLDSIQSSIITLNTLINPDYDNVEKQPILVASKTFIESFDSCFTRMGDTYKKYHQEIIDSGTNMVYELNQDYQIVLNNIKNIENELNTYKADVENISKPVDIFLKKYHKEPRIYFEDNIDHSYEFDIELINKYPGSYFWELFHSYNMWMDNGDIYIDHNGENYEFILKYMKNDDTLIEELKNMDIKKRNEFVNDLDYLKLPVKIEYMSELCYDEDKMKMEAWKKRVIMVNGKNAFNLNMYLKKSGLFDTVFNKCIIENIKYNQEEGIMYANFMLNYGDFIEDYCKNGKVNEELIKKEKKCNSFQYLNTELKITGIELNEKEKYSIIKLFENRLLRGSLILVDQSYDTKLQEWLGSQYQWKLIYRASEHNYTAKSFHQYCDNKGPTLIIIKSLKGWIFGGYTTQSWKNTSSNFYERKNDSKSFIFTLKNPYNVPPTKYNKLKDSHYSIYCNSTCGPVFDNGNTYGCDIYISDNCNRPNSCCIDNDGKHSYECNSQYKKSLFVNTNKPDERNEFSICNYEVYTINQ